MDNTPLHTKLESAVNKFRRKAKKEIESGKRIISSPEDDKEVQVTGSAINNGLSTICPNKTSDLKKDLIEHFNKIRNYLSLCSSPTSFKTAWQLRSEKLTPYDADNLVIQGGQLIPHNQRSQILHYGEQGVILGKNKRLVLSVRHSEGNYDDELNELAEFTYQPPNNNTGMLRYRWCQYLSNELEISYIVLVVLWFEYSLEEYDTEDKKNNLNHVFMIAPAKIIKYKNDIKDLNKSLENPIRLKIITRKEALSTLRNLFSLNSSDTSIKNRPALSEKVFREWEYNKIKSSKKGRKIKKWAQKNGKVCYGDCGREFKDVNLRNITFGHIISQDWENSFSFLGMKVHHPYNLYLTCRKCNSKLGSYFPEQNLRDKIVNNGTIGDWIRENEKEIRKEE
ncbi:MAG: hypothetical protein ACQEQF_12950 [Bacillota bacterium]